MSYPRGSLVRSVHDGYNAEGSDTWPYMRTPSVVAVPPQALEHRSLPASPVPADAYRMVVKEDLLGRIVGVPKHVFKVREQTKLLLFVGVAAGAILLLDLSVRLLASSARRQ
jgi:hypothetical protein